jgi:hypothetical protein
MGDAVSAGDRCQLERHHVLMRTSRAAIFTNRAGDDVEGCWRATGRRFRFVDPYLTGWYRPPAMALAGAWVAVGVNDENGNLYWEVANLRTHRSYVSRSVLQVPGAAVLTSAGDLAWTACGGVYTRPSSRKGCTGASNHYVDVYIRSAAAGSASTAAGRRTVVEARSIDPVSLRYRHGVLSWVQRGRRRGIRWP